ncbi:hypothetical protein FGF1_26150 [Flavobacteriaceae bacterium GF1]
MKKYTLSFLFFLSLHFSFSQIVHIPNGTSGITNSSNSNIGIGTNWPDKKFTVFGDVRLGSDGLGGGFQRNGVLIQNNGTRTELRWQHFGQNTNPYIAVDPAFDAAKLLFGTNGSDQMVLQSNGNVGIGITNPEGNLQIGHSTENGMLFLGGGKGYSGIGSTRSDGGLALGWNIYSRYDDPSDNSKVRVGKASSRGYSGIKMNQKGVIDFFGRDGAVVADEIANTDQNIKMRIDKHGNIGIGTLNPDMKLTVKGKIHAEEVKIDLNVPAPDYVFKEDYQLRSIEEVEKFVQENNHLPEIPSAAEFKQNGVMLAEMDMNLLKKIEELTLYTIQQEKEIEKLKLQNKKLLELQSRLKKLESER